MVKSIGNKSISGERRVNWESEETKWIHETSVSRLLHVIQIWQTKLVCFLNDVFININSKEKSISYIYLN